MTTSLEAPPAEAEPAAPRGRFGDTGLLVVASVIAIIIAVYTGLTISGGGSKVAVLLPLALPAILLLVGIALTRFEWLVILLLAVRASLDSLKLSAPPSKVVREGAPVAHGLDPAALVAMGFILAATVWLVWNRTSHQAKPKQPAMERALILLVVVWSFSVLGSQRPVTSFFEIVRMSAVVFMLVVLDRLLTNTEKIKPLLVAVFVSAIVPLLFAAYQAVSTHGRFEAGGFSRIRATFVHPNPFALYLTFLILMAAAIIPHIKGRPRILLAVLMVGLGIALVLTYTRTAWICTVVGLVLIGLLQSKRMLLVLVIGGILVLMAVPSVGARFSDLSSGSSASGNANNSLIWRFDYWTETLHLAKSNPVTGIGLKMAQLNTDERKAPHNDFIRAFVETGFLGLLAYLWLLCTMVNTAWSAVVRARRGFDRGVAVGFAACVLAFMLMSLVSNVVSQVVLLWYFFAFGAAAIAVIRYSPGDVAESERDRVGVALPE